MRELKKKEYTNLKPNFNNNKNLLFARRINAMQEVLVKVLNKDKEDISFMNINKRGGISYTDMTILNTYAMQFSDNIIEEIEIINPEIIVCCGAGIKRVIEMIYIKCNKKLDRNIVEVPHPSRVISNKKYINYLIRQLDNLK